MDALIIAVALLLPYFPAPVQAWGADIAHWSYRYDLDPALIMVVMQMESCGHPHLTSSAGASGLFQVMPHHFAAGEDRYSPYVNAHRGLSYLRQCQGLADGDPPTTLACYNGGTTRVYESPASWPNETQRYVFWGDRLLDRATLADFAHPIYASWWSLRRFACERDGFAVTDGS